MKKSNNASMSIKRVLIISLVLVFISSIGVMAGSTKFNSVIIVLSNGYEMRIITTKTKVEDILRENYIELLGVETVTPSLNENILDNNTIIISRIESTENVDILPENVLDNYSQIIEKIVIEKVEVPFETITKDVSTGSSTRDTVTQEGKNGLNEVTYKIKYQNGIEIEKLEISSIVIEEVQDKIIEVRTNVTTSRGEADRTQATSSPAVSSSSALAQSVADITPSVSSFSASAYCSCSSCCGKSNGITSSGAMATAWKTIAAGSNLPIGTVVYIPEFKNEVNGGWFVVQDRGGSITSNKIDVFMESHSAALQFGRKTLTCYIYKF